MIQFFNENYIPEGPLKFLKELALQMILYDLALYNNLLSISEK